MSLINTLIESTAETERQLTARLAAVTDERREIKRALRELARYRKRLGAAPVLPLDVSANGEPEPPPPDAPDEPPITDGTDPQPRRRRKHEEVT